MKRQDALDEVSKAIGQMSRGKRVTNTDLSKLREYQSKDKNYSGWDGHVKSNGLKHLVPIIWKDVK